MVRHHVIDRVQRQYALMQGCIDATTTLSRTSNRRVSRQGLGMPNQSGWKMKPDFWFIDAYNVSRVLQICTAPQTDPKFHEAETIQEWHTD